MQRGAAIAQSIAFHGLVVVALAVGVPYLGSDIAPSQPVLTVDIVDILPETNLDEGIEQEAKPSASAPEEPESQEAEAETPPPAPPPAPPSPQSPETAEAVPAPSSGEPAPEKKPEQTQEAKNVDVKAPPKKPQSAATQKREQQQAALTSKLQDLTEREAPAKRRNKGAEEAKDKLAEILKKNQDSTDDADKAKVEEDIEQLIGQALNVPRRTDSALGVSVLDKLRNHLANCWSPPPGAAGADSLIVDIIVRLNAEAEVQGVKIVDERKFAQDNVFRAAANAARRAILDCSPLPLPLDSYEDWKEIRFEFNPRFITRS